MDGGRVKERAGRDERVVVVQVHAVQRDGVDELDDARAAVDVGLLQQRREVVVQAVGEVVDLADVDDSPFVAFDIDLRNSIRPIFGKSSMV